MKKIIFTLVLSFISNVFSYSQNYAVEDGKIVIQDVILTDMTIEQAHDALETFFAGAYVNSNHTNKLNSPTHLVYVGIFDDLTRFSMGIWKISANHNIDIMFKEGRCRVKIYCDLAEVTNGRDRINYVFADYVPVTDKYDMVKTASPKSAVIKAFEEMVRRMQDMEHNVARVLSQPAADDNW